MPDMQEQVLIDAKKLFESAQRSAEEKVLQRHQDDVKKLLEAALNEEEELLLDDEGADPNADMDLDGVPDIEQLAGEPLDDPMMGGGDPMGGGGDGIETLPGEPSHVTDGLPLGVTSGAEEGIEINLDDIFGEPKGDVEPMDDLVDRPDDVEPVDEFQEDELMTLAESYLQDLGDEGSGDQRETSDTEELAFDLLFDEVMAQDDDRLDENEKEALLKEFLSCCSNSLTGCRDVLSRVSQDLPVAGASAAVERIVEDMEMMLDGEGLYERVDVHTPASLSGNMGRPEAENREAQAYEFASEEDDEYDELEAGPDRKTPFQNPNHAMSRELVNEASTLLDEYEKNENILKKKIDVLLKENKNLKDVLAETSSLNNKLHLMNRVLTDSSLNEWQKKNTVKKISRARSSREAEVIFESAISECEEKQTLNESKMMKKTNVPNIGEIKKALNESKIRRQNDSAEIDPAVERMQILAGIRKQNT